MITANSIESMTSGKVTILAIYEEGRRKKSKIKNESLNAKPVESRIVKPHISKQRCYVGAVFIIL